MHPQDLRPWLRSIDEAAINVVKHGAAVQIVTTMTVPIVLATIVSKTGGAWERWREWGRKRQSDNRARIANPVVTILAVSVGWSRGAEVVVDA